MGVVLGLGIFWTLYGIAGMLGFQVINEKYKNHAWTTEYIHSCGISWFILGVPELILYLLVCGRGVNTLVVSLLILLCGVPSIVYTVIKDQKYKHMLKEQ